MNKKATETPTPEKPKLAIICARGLANFLPFLPRLQDEYDVKLFEVTTNDEIHEAMWWAHKGTVWLEWCNDIAVIATNAEWCRETAVIVRLHSYEVFENFAERVKWDVVDELIFVAPHIGNLFMNRPGISDLKMLPTMTIIPNGVDVDTIECDTMRPLTTDIAVVGSINHKKNPAMVLQVLSELVKHGDYNIHWAGAFQDQRYRTYLEYMVSEMHLSDRIRFHGHIDNMDAFWKGKSYLLHTSVHEGHSLAITEAMARGIKPAIHNYYGAKEQYPDYLLFNDIDEACEIINKGGKYIPETYRNHVIESGWTLDAQTDSILEVIERAREGY